MPSRASGRVPRNPQVQPPPARGGRVLQTGLAPTKVGPFQRNPAPARRLAGHGRRCDEPLLRELHGRRGVPPDLQGLLATGQDVIPLHPPGDADLWLVLAWSDPGGILAVGGRAEREVVLLREQERGRVGEERGQRPGQRGHHVGRAHQRGDTPVAHGSTWTSGRPPPEDRQREDRPDRDGDLLHREVRYHLQGPHCRGCPEQGLCGGAGPEAWSRSPTIVTARQHDREQDRPNGQQRDDRLAAGHRARQEQERQARQQRRQQEQVACPPVEGGPRVRRIRGLGRGFDRGRRRFVADAPCPLSVQR